MCFHGKKKDLRALRQPTPQTAVAQLTKSRASDTRLLANHTRRPTCNITCLKKQWSGNLSDSLPHHKKPSL